MHTQEINEYPEDVKAEYLRLSAWVQAMRKAHGERLLIRIVDPQSLGGFWKVLRHRIRRYPTFFIDNAQRADGWEGNPEAAIARTLGERGSPVPGG